MKKKSEVRGRLYPCAKKVLLIMRLTIFLILLGLFSSSASVYSQSTKLTLKMKNSRIAEVFDAIEQQSEFYFFYNRDNFDDNQLVNVDFEGKQVEEILDELFTGTSVTYEVVNRNILIKTKSEFPGFSDSKQESSISGTVTDDSGLSLPGVTVVLKGTTIGTITDFDGKYTITNIPANSTLLISFVGMRSQEIVIGDQTVINVTLLEETIGLDEVVVTGYSIEKKKDIIGSVAVVDTDEMLSTPSGNITNQLQGRAAGVSVSGSGDPGKAARVRIRGFGTFGESEPLYVIDGVPSDANRLNPNDIESIQILKDAASAAVYGARAANGVIIITTKQGKQGGVKVSLDSYYGIQHVNTNAFPDVLNAEEYGQVYWRAMEGGGISSGDAAWNHLQYGSGASPVIPEYIFVNDNGRRYGGAELEYLRSSDSQLFNYLVDPSNYDLKTHQIVRSGDTNWFEETFKPAPIQSHQLTVSGGADGSTYLISLNYFDQKSTASDESYYKRYSARGNSVLAISDKIKVGENIQVSYQKARDVSLVESAYFYHPLIPVRDIAGNMAGSAAPMVTDFGRGQGMNPVLAPSREFADYNESYGFFGNVFTELELVKDLRFRSTFGFDLNNRIINNFYPFYYENYENSQPVPDRLELFTRNVYKWVFTNTVNYSKTFDSHTFKVLLGTEAVNEVAKTVNASRYSYTEDLQKYEEFLVLDAGTGTQANSGGITKSTLYSLFARLDYTYGDKYMMNATVRRDGSSKFGSNNRYGIFPSVAVGWRISQESFMQDIEWLTDMKVRASAGIIGNLSGLDPRNQYNVFTSQDAYSYPISGENNTVNNSYTLVRIGNPEARWEKTKISNIGIDATLLEGSISLSGEYYQRLTDDLLVQNQPPQTGPDVIQPYVNVGSMRNRGFDFSASYRGTIGSDLQFDLSANYSMYRNKVLKVLDNDAATITSDYNRTEKGYPMAYFFGFVTDGFFNSQAEVDAYDKTSYLTPKVGGWRIKDINNDGTVNDLDRTMIGSPHPDFQINTSLSLTYKNFDFFTTVLWSQGGEVYNSFRGTMETNLNRAVLSTVLTDSWTADNHNASLPILDIYAEDPGVTDHLIEDATYARVKTIQLGYTLPRSITDRIQVDNLRVYVQVQNPFTWTKEFSGLDPDAAYSGNVKNPDNQYITDLESRTSDLELGNVQVQTPTPQQVLFGVNLTF